MAISALIQNAMTQLDARGREAGVSADKIDRFAVLAGLYRPNRDQVAEAVGLAREIAGLLPSGEEFNDLRRALDAASQELRGITGGAAGRPTDDAAAVRFQGVSPVQSKVLGTAQDIRPIPGWLTDVPAFADGFDDNTAQIDVTYGDPPDGVEHPVLDALRAQTLWAVEHSNIPQEDRENFLTLVRAQVRTISIKFNLLRDDGSYLQVLISRVQHNNARGPNNGSIRLVKVPWGSADNLDDLSKAYVGEVRFLAAGNSLKTAVVDLPYGGGGGTVYVPGDLSIAEQKRLFYAYGWLFAPYIGPDEDIPAPDINTRSYHMDALRAGYEARVGRPGRVPAVVTGKTVSQGGSLGRDEATGRGGFEIAGKILEERGLGWSMVTVAVNGYGNAGQHAARLAQMAGGKVVAINDTRGTLFDLDGLPRRLLLDEARKKTSAEVKGGKYYLSVPPRLTEKIEMKDSDAFWDVQADVYFIASREHVLTPEVARRLKEGSILIELANAPTHPEADEILKERDITVVPDILANAGGVTVSYFEWRQNLLRRRWPLERVQRELHRLMLDAYDRVKSLADREDITLRQAALILAVEDIYDAEKERNPGFTPPSSTGGGPTSPPTVGAAGGAGEARVAGGGQSAAGGNSVRLVSLSGSGVRLVGSDGDQGEDSGLRPSGKSRLPVGAHSPWAGYRAGVPLAARTTLFSVAP